MKLRATEATFVKHESCPACGSRDNLGRYTDGHAWCFGCGYYEAAKATEAPIVTQRKEAETARYQHRTGQILLPFDSSFTIGGEALSWLAEFGITRKEIVEHDLKWSAHKHGLIFPIYDGNTLIGYTMRHFHHLSAYRWTKEGNFADILDIRGLTTEEDSGILVVEDIVSAIKCSRHIPTLCLYGTHVNEILLQRLKNLTQKVFLWLDPDATRKAVGIANRCTEHGLRVKVIGTARDPKEETDMEILKQLGVTV